MPGSSTCHTTVVATPDGIAIKEQGAWRAKSTEIPAADILDLDYSLGKSLTGKGKGGFLQGSPPPRWVSTLNRLAASKGVTVKTRRGLFTFGAGLPDDEGAYLHAVVPKVISVGLHR